MMFDFATGRPMTDHEGKLVTPDPMPAYGFTPPPKPELEFRVMAFMIPADTAPFSSAQLAVIADPIEQLLNEGWRIGDKTICPPFVMMTFVREKKAEG